mmetsp:Transcript_5133/g.7074  ORF Transcript_5133/g.7074 Transcript_5133/m.7074 type:complete len:302 (+) Transcript_5133:196-1101(+)
MRQGGLHFLAGLHLLASQSLGQQQLQVANGSHPGEEDEPRGDAVGDAVGEAHGGHGEEGRELVHGVLEVHLLHVGQRVHAHHHQCTGGGGVGDDGDEGLHEQQRQQEGAARDDGGQSRARPCLHSRVGLHETRDGVGSDHPAQSQAEAVHAHRPVDPGHGQLRVALHEAAATHDARQRAERVEQLHEQKGPHAVPEERFVRVLPGELARRNVRGVHDEAGAPRLAPDGQVGHALVVGVQRAAVHVVDAHEGRQHDGDDDGAAHLQGLQHRHDRESQHRYASGGVLVEADDAVVVVGEVDVH